VALQFAVQAEALVSGEVRDAARVLALAEVLGVAPDADEVRDAVQDEALVLRALLRVQEDELAVTILVKEDDHPSPRYNLFHLASSSCLPHSVAPD